ncbi:MAG: DUF4446 family protein [Candidatus Moranbacteria bacterium]|nr:DUF4446 family protein [Candidatus Moranbacteria bacterium]
MEGLFSPSSAILFALGASGFAVLSFALSLTLFLRIRHMKRDLSSFLSGKDGENLEALILKQESDISALNGEIKNLYEAAEELYLLGQESIHRTEVVRFNPFKEVGGNQSFVIAFLNGRNTGFVLSSLHTREGTRIYAKPVLNGAETDGHPLSKEEKYAISLAAKKRVGKEDGAK